jgi:hypothetical protein
MMILGKINKFEVDLINHKQWVEICRIFDKNNIKLDTYLNKRVKKEGVKIKFKWDRATYKTTISIKLDEPISPFKSELIFKEIYLLMLQEVRGLNHLSPTSQTNKVII